MSRKDLSEEYKKLVEKHATTVKEISELLNRKSKAEAEVYLLIYETHKEKFTPGRVFDSMCVKALGSNTDYEEMEKAIRDLSYARRILEGKMKIIEWEIDMESVGGKGDK